MFLRSRPENKRKCKICGKEGFVDSCKPIFKCPICNWIEDEWQENNPNSKDGRNKKTFNKTQKEYIKHKKKYGILVNKIIKVKMKNGEIKEGACRDYSYNSILIPNNGMWIDIKDIKSIKIVKDVITIECPILVNNDDKEVDENTCRAISFCVNNPNMAIETEKWIKKYNENYSNICRECKHNFKIFISKPKDNMEM